MDFLLTGWWYKSDSWFCFEPMIFTARLTTRANLARFLARLPYHVTIFNTRILYMRDLYTDSKISFLTLKLLSLKCMFARYLLEYKPTTLTATTAKKEAHGEGWFDQRTRCLRQIGKRGCSVICR